MKKLIILIMLIAIIAVLLVGCGIKEIPNGYELTANKDFGAIRVEYKTLYSDYQQIYDEGIGYNYKSSYCSYVFKGDKFRVHINDPYTTHIKVTSVDNPDIYTIYKIK